MATLIVLLLKGCKWQEEEGTGRCLTARMCKEKLMLHVTLYLVFSTLFFLDSNSAAERDAET